MRNVTVNNTWRGLVVGLIVALILAALGGTSYASDGTGVLNPANGHNYEAVTVPGGID